MVLNHGEFDRLSLLLFLLSPCRLMGMALLVLVLMLTSTSLALVRAYVPQICIVGSGISGSAAAHFLRSYSVEPVDIHVFEQSSNVGGRMAVLDIDGSKFEAGASFLHPKNLYAAHFTQILGLKKQKIGGDVDGNFGMWDGSSFIFMTKKISSASYISRTWADLQNKIALFWRYKISLLRMNKYVSEKLAKFMRFYDRSKPVFYTVEEMLRWAEIYELTQSPMEAQLQSYGLSQKMIDELVAVIMRMIYAQSKSISGMAGAASLCGFGDNFWAVEGGNWQMAAGLLQLSNATLLLSRRVISVMAVDGGYNITTASEETRFCSAVILATSLDESHITFNPSVSLPKRCMQHTHVTFVRGIINPNYFGKTAVSSVPNLIGTPELPSIPFISIHTLKIYHEDDRTYKVYSRTSLSEDFLDSLFKVRKRTVHFDWAAYPHYHAPEAFAPFVLDGKHLYYINAFENAASTMETSAIAAENVVRVVLSRIPEAKLRSQIPDPISQSMLETDL